MRPLTRILPAVFICLLSLPVRAVEVGAPLGVAPEAKGTRNQTWASVAWCEDAQCWLVVWREGYLNELESQIWCARVSADGKALDPGGIQLTSRKELKDRPRVASDGKGFLVVWEDFRNGKDWDVYAARVSAKGSALDPDGFLLAGGEHNQCRPDVVSSGGRYCVLWMAFSEGAYNIHGRCVSSEGKVFGDAAAEVFRSVPGKRAHKYNSTQGIFPVISVGRDGGLLSAFFVTDKRRKRYVAWQPVNPKTGGRSGAISQPPGRRDKKAVGGHGSVKQRAVALALGSDGAMIASCAGTKSNNDIALARISKAGAVLEIQELKSAVSMDEKYKPIQPRPGVVFDGKNYVVVTDSLRKAGKGEPGGAGSGRAVVVGWRVPPGGKVGSAHGFAVGGEGNRECMLPAVAVGPAGVCLVVYSEVRGVDDVKVMTRAVR